MVPPVSEGLRDIARSLPKERCAAPTFTLAQADALAAASRLPRDELERGLSELTTPERVDLYERVEQLRWFLPQGFAAELAKAAREGSEALGITSDGLAGRFPQLFELARTSGVVPDRADSLLASLSWSVAQVACRDGSPAARAHVLERALQILGSPYSRAYWDLDRLIDHGLDVRYPEDGQLTPFARAVEERFGSETTYANRQPEVFQTPYVDLVRVLSALQLRPGEQVTDLGSAYGRLGFVLGRTRPDVPFVGYELLAERVAEARRVAQAHGLENVRYEPANLADPHVRLSGEVFFAYDPFSEATLAKVLAKLREHAASRPIRLVAVAGEQYFIPTLRKQGWLDGGRRLALPGRRDTYVFNSILDSPGARP